MAQTPVNFTINGRAVSFPDDTPVLLDGQVATVADVQRRPNGMQVRWNDAALRAPGGVPALIFSYNLIGTITSHNPLTILGQPLTITGDTVKSGFVEASEMPIGTHVVAAGLVDANGSLWASLVERRAGPGNRFFLSGHVQEVGVGGLYRIGDQWIDADALVWPGCVTNAPGLGDFVEVAATAIANFVPGSTLQSILEGRCALPVPLGTVGAAGSLQGLISDLTDDTHFNLGGLVVTHGPATTFVFGSADDLDLGMAITVEGAFTGAQAITADVIEFVRPVVRFTGPVGPSNVIPNGEITVLNVASFWNPQVRDDDNYFANGMTATRQVEARGYLDRDGMAWATRVRDRGNADLNDARLRGPVATINAPNFIIQGIAIDVTGAAFFDDLGNPISQAAFFNLLAPTHLVDITGATFNPTAQTLTGGSISYIGAEAIVPPPLIAGGAPIQVRGGTASGYAIGPDIFRNGFENN